MAVEIEFKYTVTGERFPMLTPLAPRWEPVEMHTTYFDTPDGQLSRRHWMLRSRRENQITLVTLKTPGPGGGRNEYELEAEDPGAALAELVTLGAPPELIVLCEAGLVPVCGARFRRLRAEVALSPECTVELALDQGKLFAGGNTAPLGELEVEVKSGNPAIARQYAQSIARQFGLTPQPAGKYARARQLLEDSQ